MPQLPSQNPASVPHPTLPHASQVSSLSFSPQETGNPTKDPPQGMHDTAMQSLVQSQLVAMGVVNHDGSPPKPAKPMSILRIRLWIALCVAFFVLAPLISVLLGYQLHAKDMDYGPIDHLFEGRTVSACSPLNGFNGADLLIDYIRSNTRCVARLPLHFLYEGI